MGSSFRLRPTPMVRIQPSYEHRSEVKFASIVPKRLDKIRFMPSKEMVPLIYLNAKHIYVNEEMLKKLRAGGFEENLVLMAIGVMVFLTFYVSGLDPLIILEQLAGAKTNAFTVNNKFGGVANPTSTQIQISQRQPQPSTQQNAVTRPVDVPHNQFHYQMTKQERRQLPHSNDMKINHEGQPELNVGYWQSEYKVVDHGTVYGLEYSLTDKGATKTEQTPQNTLKMMKSIVNMPNRENVKWFKEDENAMYQGGRDHEIEAVHIYDIPKQVIAVFNRATGNFITTCQLTDTEHRELMATGNFGGKDGWFSGKVSNIPPTTPVNSFESDLKGITPINNSQVDNP